LQKCNRCGGDIYPEARYCSACGARAGGTYEQFYISSDNLVQKVKELVHEGNVTRIIVKDEKGVTLIEIPVTIGVVGALLAPLLAALGVITALAAHCTLIVERREVQPAATTTSSQQ